MTDKKQGTSFWTKQSIQQYSNFRHNSVSKARAITLGRELSKTRTKGLRDQEKPLSGLDLYDWVDELGIKYLEDYSQEIISKK